VVVRAAADQDVHPAGAAVGCSRWTITRGGEAGRYANVSVDNRASTR